jgi:hypothetical protein
VAPRLDTAELKIREGIILVGVVIRWWDGNGNDGIVRSVVREVVNEVDLTRIVGQSRESSLAGSGITFEVLTIANIMGAQEFSIRQHGARVEAVCAGTDETSGAVMLFGIGLKTVDRGAVLMV